MGAQRSGLNRVFNNVRAVFGKATEGSGCLATDFPPELLVLIALGSCFQSLSILKSDGFRIYTQTVKSRIPSES
jgi:hypothetical protein